SSDTVPLSPHSSVAHRVLHSFLHDALPISRAWTSPAGNTLMVKPLPGTRCALTASLSPSSKPPKVRRGLTTTSLRMQRRQAPMRSEEHTSELQSRFDLVCRLLLEKKKKEYT